MTNQRGAPATQGGGQHTDHIVSSFQEEFWREWDAVWESARAQGPVPPTVEADEAAAFLGRLGGEFGFRTIKKGAMTTNHGPVPFSKVRDKLRRLNEDGFNVFFVVNELDGEGFEAKNVTRVRAVFVDLDEGGREALRRVLGFHLPPNLVFETSPGKFHCYWLVDGLPLGKFTAVQKALAERFGGDPSVSDLPRIMRLPGFLHQKGEPFRSRLVYANNRPPRYSAGEIVEALLPDGAGEELPTRAPEPGEFSIEEVTNALGHLDPADRETWREVGMALKYHALRGDVDDETAFAVWDEWSQKTKEGNYSPRNQGYHWGRDFDRTEGQVVTVGTIFKRAYENGWERPTVVLRTDEEAFVARSYGDAHGDVWHWRGDFYQWSGAWWRPLDEEDLKARLYLWLEHARVKKGEGTRRYRPDKTKVNKVIDALSGVRHLDNWREAPFWTDPRPEDPEPADLLPFRNGVLDLRTFEMREADPRLFAVHRVDCDYDPTAEAPTWDRFLREVFPDDEQSQRCVEEMMGYCLTGDTSQQKAFLLQGVKRSGKGTILRVLREMVGRDRWTAPTITQFSNTDFGLQPLIGKAVAAISDARGNDAKNPHVVTERILTITGEDAVSVNRKHKPFWDGVLPTRILYVSNVPPKMNDPSGVIVSRFVAIHFRVSFADQEDPDLTGKLLAELPGIVNRALAGLRRLRERGRFEQPESGKELLEQMEQLTGPVQAFVHEECKLDAEYEVEAQRLYDAFCEWCKANGHHQMASSTFGRDLFALNQGIKKVRPYTVDPETGRRRKGQPVYRGIMLVEDDVEAPY